MNDETIKGYLDFLTTVRGLKGYTLQAGNRLLINQLPATLHGAGEGVCTLINEFLNAYHEYGRPVQQACFETAAGFLVMLREAPPPAPLPPPSEPTLIALLLEDPAAVPVVVTAGNSLLKHCGSRLRTLSQEVFAVYNAPPDSDWTYFKGDLLGMISKVVGSAQSERLLTRVQTELGLDRGKSVPNSEFKRLGEALVSSVPNTSRQQFLREELNHLLSEFA